jgi:hypothetical protein
MRETDGIRRGETEAGAIGTENHERRPVPSGNKSVRFGECSELGLDHPIAMNLTHNCCRSSQAESSQPTATAFAIAHIAIGTGAEGQFHLSA